MNSRISWVAQDVESRCQEMEERGRHQMRCSALLRQEMDPLTTGGMVHDGVYDVPMPPRAAPSVSPTAADGLSLDRLEVEEPPVPRVRVLPLGTERVTYTNMRAKGRGSTRGTRTRRIPSARPTHDDQTLSDASELWD